MKKILNWTLGGFFRTFGRILVYICLGLLISLIIQKSDIKPLDLIGIDTIHAATSITPSNYKHKVVGKIYNDGIFQSNIDSDWISGDYTGFCPSNRDCFLQYDYYYVILPSSLNPGQTYTWSFHTWVTTRPSQVNLNKIQYWLTASNTGAYNGSSTANINIFNCKAGIEEGTSTKITFTCSVTPANQINYLYLRMTYPNVCPTGHPGCSINAYWPFTSYSCDRGTLTYDNSQTDAINQQTNIIQNQTDIINNNITDSTNQILDGLEGINEANQVCNYIDKNSIIENYKALNANGGVYSVSNENAGVTDFISLSSKDKLKSTSTLTWTEYACFYNINKTTIECKNVSSFNGDITIPENTAFFRSTIRSDYNKPTYQLCKNGNQALSDTLTDDNTSEAENEAGSFFENFTTNTHGLTSIITAPLTAIESLTSKTCSPLVLPLPFVNEDLTLPCMRPIYEENFGGFMTLYDAITLGIVSYWILVRIFALVKDFKNPDHDEIEVVDL